jgi:hypothetical protein
MVKSKSLGSSPLLRRSAIVGSAKAGGFPMVLKPGVTVSMFEHTLENGGSQLGRCAVGARGLEGGNQTGKGSGENDDRCHQDGQW